MESHWNTMTIPGTRLRMFCTLRLQLAWASPTPMTKIIRRMTQKLHITTIWL
ncbi:hypothetical protein AB205_0078500 [Aquarana catesbeiana]|uniref:Uncharacterized protein n=1 Tax=Aquarana catesbeiana TaxID=8400 RepID=A0A2G9RDB8_AQUCT|nr:hypothetical protein AB205_0078500 [Aquarana catesbeiana]